MRGSMALCAAARASYGPRRGARQESTPHAEILRRGVVGSHDTSEREPSAILACDGISARCAREPTLP